jgi:hypothetical protein
VPSGATVDLSHNALSGRVPPELATAAEVYLNGNRFAGEVPAEIAAAAEGGRMRVLFLQDNFLNGIMQPMTSTSPAVLDSGEKFLLSPSTPARNFCTIDRPTTQQRTERGDLPPPLGLGSVSHELRQGEAR